MLNSFIKTRRGKSYLTIFGVILLFCVSYSRSTRAQESNDGKTFLPITPENADKLELGYALLGDCGDISPTGKQIVIVDDGVYDFSTGQRRLAISNTGIFRGWSPSFSPDGKYIIARGEDVSVYDLTTGERRRENFGDTAFFSPDGKVIVFEDGVYDFTTGQRRFELASDRTWVKFSPDSSLLVVGSQDVVYDVQTGEIQFRVSAGTNTPISVFSADGKLLIIGSKVFDTLTGKLLFQVEKHTTGFPVFSPDSSMLAIQGTGVYDTTTGQIRFETTGVDNIFSPDGKLLFVDYDAVYDTLNGGRVLEIVGSAAFSPDGAIVAQSDGIYDAATGELRFSLSQEADVPALSFTFSPDGKLVLTRRVSSWNMAMYDSFTGRFYDSIQWMPALPSPTFTSDGSILVLRSEFNTCLVYGHADNEWPYRSGIIRVNNVNIRKFPEADAEVIGSGDDQMIVFARTSDDKWYKVFYGGSYTRSYGWVSVSVAQIVFMPDGVPVEGG